MFLKNKKGLGFDFFLLPPFFIPPKISSLIEGEKKNEKKKNEKKRMKKRNKKKPSPQPKSNDRNGENVMNKEK